MRFACALRAASGSCVVLASALALCLAPSAARAATYEYVGNPFDSIVDATVPAGTHTTSMRMTASVELLNPIAPNSVFDVTLSPTDLVSASLSDGRGSAITWADTDLSESRLTLTTDSAGAIIRWSVEMWSPGLIPSAQGEQAFGRGTHNSLTLGVGDLAFVRECTLVAGCVSTLGVGEDSALILGNPGTWTLIPEPGTAALVGLGLLALAARGRGRRVRRL